MGTFHFVPFVGHTGTFHFVPFVPYWQFYTNGIKYFNIEGPNKETVEFSQYL